MNHCTSCQMCAAVCPVNCISFTENAGGFYRPQVDAEKCVECGLCQSVCYKYDRNAAPAAPPDGATLYGAWAKDPAVVAATTSGGIADLLTKALIGEGYVCCGASYDSRTARAVHVTADTAEATDCFRGSKYIQSFTARAFTEVAERLRKGERVAVAQICGKKALPRPSAACGPVLPRLPFHARLGQMPERDKGKCGRRQCYSM